MKNRLFAMFGALALLLSFSAAAADTENGIKDEALSLEGIAARMQSGSALCRAYDELIAAADAVNRSAAYDDLVEANNALTDVIWVYYQAGETGAAMLLQAKQDQLQEQLEDYKPENYSNLYDKQVRPVKALRDQLILSAEQFYLNLSASEQDLARGRLELERLERAAQDTRLLQSLGRASAWESEVALAARNAAQRDLAALAASYEAGKAQLQFLLGATETGALTLAPVPEVTDEQLAALSYDADLASGLTNSCELYLAQIKADEAKEDWHDAEYGYQRTAAEHTYHAAVYTRDAEEQKFRQAFDAVYRSLNAARAAVEAAQENQADAQKAYDAAKLRYEIGRISESALKNVGSELALTQLGVGTAKLGLAAAYHNYCWAMQGVITAQP